MGEGHDDDDGALYGESTISWDSGLPIRRMKSYGEEYFYILI